MARVHVNMMVEVYGMVAAHRRALRDDVAVDAGWVSRVCISPRTEAWGLGGAAGAATADGAAAACR